MLKNAKLQTIIWTSRLDEARIFYENVLELEFQEVSDGALVFDVGGSELRVSPVPDAGPSPHTVAGFGVDDVDAEVQRLGERGVTFERFDGLTQDEVGLLNTPDGSRVAWFRDPDGNLLSVVQFHV